VSAALQRSVYQEGLQCEGVRPGLDGLFVGMSTIFVGMRIMFAPVRCLVGCLLRPLAGNVIPSLRMQG
jgi:hypothetical protein